MLGFVAALLAGPALAQKADKVAALAPQLDALFAEFTAAQHVPGLVWGVVVDGRLVHVRGLGVQDLASKAPVTADTRFRIASMSKAFTALTILDLRDQGKLRLDAPAEDYVPELKGWRYPTSDSPKIRVRDLLHHVSGLVEDDPWGDRQTPLPEADFTAMLAAGVPFSRVPAERHEYSNFGYATLGRMIRNVTGRPFEAVVADTLFRPLGMARTGYDVLAVPQGERALGYRYENDAFAREPELAAGAFGAMGGVETTANDYARYVGWLLGAWPARDGAETGPMQRATVRELVQGLNFMRFAPRRADLGPACAQAVAYGMGFRMIEDCDLGSYMTHTGGYPGYGSVLMMLPEAGVAVFAFANRTYAAPVAPAYAALKRLKAEGLAAVPPLPVSPALARSFDAAKAVWAAGDIMAAGYALAMNMLLDRSAANWKLELARLRTALGTGRTETPIEATSAMAGRFAWACDRGRLAGSLLLAPGSPPTRQAVGQRVERWFPELACQRIPRWISLVPA
ncbi:serine hydrolase domain-containing protein [Polymorphobacter multimanifer]|uniref:serine hydrolase domain-containing protein n=1 Tax=Polymorphobacter multimanifer TaxID=1070431 RepID=UPI001FB18AF5|nr:serine hydrolase domain-containing protein [Polymorphobacter multimanifer]